MIYLLGQNLISTKFIYLALTQIYGIGIITSKKILKTLNINPILKVNELTSNQINDIRIFLENSNLHLEGDLKKFINLNIKRLIDIKCYRGIRHRKHLPTRGQRTRTNNRTIRRNNLLFNNKK